VTLLKKKHGKFKGVGHDLTSTKGGWKVEVPRAHGTYRASVKEDTVPTDSGRAVCEADKSDTLKV
jgi:hypothetical protein